MSTPAQVPQKEKKIPVVHGSIVNNVCPKCGNISLPRFSGTTTAVMCQNPECKFIAEKGAPAAQDVAGAQGGHMKPVISGLCRACGVATEDLDQHKRERRGDGPGRPASPAVVVVQPADVLADIDRPPKPADQLQWLRFAENTDQHRVTVEARVKQLIRASRIFRQNAETGAPFDRAAAMQLLAVSPQKKL